MHLVPSNIFNPLICTKVRGEEMDIQRMCANIESVAYSMHVLRSVPLSIRSTSRRVYFISSILQYRMSTNRPWPSSPNCPFGHRARCSWSHWQQHLLQVPLIHRALCQAPPPVTHFLKQQQHHVLKTSMCSANLWTLSEIKTKKLRKMWRGSGNGWPRSHGVRGGISLTLNLLTWTVMWVVFCWSWKSPTTQTMSRTHWQVSIGQLTVNWRRSAMVIVWLIPKSLSWARKC